MKTQYKAVCRAGGSEVSLRSLQRWSRSAPVNNNTNPTEPQEHSTLLNRHHTLRLKGTYVHIYVVIVREHHRDKTNSGLKRVVVVLLMLAGSRSLPRDSRARRLGTSRREVRYNPFPLNMFGCKTDHLPKQARDNHAEK